MVRRRSEPESASHPRVSARRIIILLVLVTASAFIWQLQTLYQRPPVSAPDTPADWILAQGLSVPAQSGFYPSSGPQGNALVINGARQLSQQRIHLCEQAAHPRRQQSGVKTLYAGLNWAQLQARMAENEARGRRPYSGIANPLLDGAPIAGPDIPEMRIGSYQKNGLMTPMGDTVAALALFPQNRDQHSHWLSDTAIDSAVSRAGGLPFRKLGWLLWAPDENEARWRYALKVERISTSQPGRCAVNYGALRLTVLEAPSGQLNQSATVWHLPADSTLPVSRQRLQAGSYEARNEGYRLEDHQLFRQAVEAGLIWAGGQGQVQLQPRDAARAAALAGHPWSDVKRSLLSALYYSAPGRYIRQQVQNWNRESRPVGVRFKPVDAAARALLSGEAGNRWQAHQGRQPLAFGGRTPLRSGGLFSQLPQGWSDWLMLKGDGVRQGSAVPVTLTLQFDQAATGTEVFELLLIGQQVRLTSGQLHQSVPRCVTHQCDTRRQLARAVRVSPPAGSTTLTLTLQPLTSDQARLLYQSDHQPVQVRHGKPGWYPQQSRPLLASARIPVTLRDRDGHLLWQNHRTLTPAIEGYMDPLFGITSGHQRSLGGMLSRLGRYGYPQVNAELTLERALQQSVREKLQQRVRKNTHPERLGSVLMMDADSGEILAAASFPEVPQGAQWPDIHALDASDFRRSPLRPRPFQHDGYSYNAPGSVFKLVVALALERAASHDPIRRKVLEGLSMQALDRAGKAGGYHFSSRADCYPAQTGCYSLKKRWPARDLRHHAIINYRKNGMFESPRTMLQSESAYGLTQALRDSLNTWFVWQAEQTDQTLLNARERYGMAHARPLTPSALDQQRPIQAMMRELGFLDNTRLDGGLLPEAFNWRPGDLLMATASRYDPFESRLSVRQAAIGLRMQVTPLHIAQLAATLASGEQRRGYLLRRLNGDQAKPPAGSPLNVELSRIRAGMKAVPVSGTAKRVFRQRHYRELRDRIYLKTGTAPIHTNRTAQGRSLNTAWLTGWLEPPESGGRRVAFACMLAFTPLTGGRDCAPLMADILHQMEQAETKTPEINIEDVGLNISR